VEKVFRVALRHDDEKPVVSVTGELDVATAPELERVLAGLSGRIVVDCSLLRFIDAGAIGTLVRASHRLDSLTLVNVDPFIRHILEVVELDALLLDADAAVDGPEILPDDAEDVPTPPPVAKAGDGP
jgi:anti-sigma B factor antagonist